MLLALEGVTLVFVYRPFEACVSVPLLRFAMASCHHDDDELSSLSQRLSWPCRAFPSASRPGGLRWPPGADLHRN